MILLLGIMFSFSGVDGEQVNLIGGCLEISRCLNQRSGTAFYFELFGVFFLVEPCVSSRCLYSWPFFQTNGNSNGLVPMLRVYNNTARYVDQGGNKVFFVTGKCWRSELKVCSYKSWFSHILFYFVFKDLFFFMWLACVYLCEDVQVGTHGVQKRALDPWGCELVCVWGTELDSLQCAPPIF